MVLTGGCVAIAAAVVTSMVEKLLVLLLAKIDQPGTNGASG
jgi:hypothetical protein